MNFSIIVVYDIKAGICSQLNEYMKLYECQIYYGASSGWGNESLFKWSRSHDKVGRHAHIW